STRSSIDVLDAMGKDYILVETVGVGQDEVDVVKSAHSTVIVVMPGMGDDVQAIKAGILEVGDIFLVNKADREGTDKTISHLKLMIDMDKDKYKEGRWKPSILKAQAVFDIGVKELVEEIDRHKEYLNKTRKVLSLRGEKQAVREELAEMVKSRIIEEVLDRLIATGEFDRAVESVLGGRKDPYTACDDLVLPKFGVDKP
ncbi:MAG: methylmalonyl Co-A mutase-associated GTPase MeaB, partial [Desulfobacterales bacterium]|nr:methylmalonyl Co-A mutase-associated GTPase MeaB [Desulfobacterales bacterium]